MALEWYEWECPYCRRIAQVNPAKEYEDGETVDTLCPNCGSKVVVSCAYEPSFYAYRSENFYSSGEREGE